MTTTKEPWVAVYAQVSPSPRAWLGSIDCGCAEYLMNVVQTVMSWSLPPRYPASGIWQIMRNDQGVDMSGFYEVRRRCEEDLYRLICRFDHPPAPAPNQPAPPKSLVVVHGYRKPDGTPARKGELEQALANWTQYAQTPRRASAPIQFPAVFCP